MSELTAEQMAALAPGDKVAWLIGSRDQMAMVAPVGRLTSTQVICVYGSTSYRFYSKDGRMVGDRHIRLLTPDDPRIVHAQVRDLVSRTGVNVPLGARTPQLVDALDQRIKALTMTRERIREILRSAEKPARQR